MKKHFVVSGLVILFCIASTVLLLPDQRTLTKTIPFTLSCRDIWPVYYDVASQASWRSDIQGIQIAASRSKRAWVETPNQGPAVNFKETAARTVQLLEPEFEAQGYFSGTYKADFSGNNGECIGTFTETVRLSSLTSKVFSYLFVDLGEQIDRYAANASAEAARRSARNNQK